MPLKHGLNENHIRWPDFNQEDLTKHKESFLAVLSYRVREHPCQFALLDCFPENKYIAAKEELIPLEDNNVFETGMALVTMTSVLEEGDQYGTKYFPADLREAAALSQGGVWPEVPAAQVMLNQRRIYHFLKIMAYQITETQTYKVADETVKQEWKLSPPDPANLKEPGYQTELQEFVDFHRDTMHYAPTNNETVNLAFGICFRQVSLYITRLQGLKASPELFYTHISDIREHSHHEVAYKENHQHKWVSHDNLLCNAKPEPLGADSR